MTRACFPGTFHPPTVAHVAIAESALRQLGVDTVDFIVSQTTLGKRDSELSDPETRVADLARLARPYGGAIGARLTTFSLLADIARGYDWLILGADKWLQIQELRWYDNDPNVRDHALASLPSVAIIERPPHILPNTLARTGPSHVRVIAIHRDFSEVSSTAVRAGRAEWLAKPKPDEMGS